MLNVIDISISKLLEFNNRTLNERDRLEYFISWNKIEFTRKNWMDIFKDISSATVSRDLKKRSAIDPIWKNWRKEQNEIQDNN